MGKRILVVDDERSITDLLAYNLQRSGYEVSTAHDGLQALRLARGEPPDLVILDLMLPGLDGLMSAAALRAPREAPSRSSCSPLRPTRKWTAW